MAFDFKRIMRAVIFVTMAVATAVAWMSGSELIAATCVGFTIGLAFDVVIEKLAESL